MAQIELYGYYLLLLFLFLTNYFYIKNRSKRTNIQPERINQMINQEEQSQVLTSTPLALVGKNDDQAPEPNVKVGKILFVLMFGMFIAVLNQTVMNVLLPLIMNDLSIATSTAQWLTTGFMLVNGILIPISAYLIEKYGFRKLFIIAMILFTIGSMICAVSGNFSLMMIGRIVQAAGAGILMPLGMNVFMTLFPPDKRGAAMGTMGIAMILAPAIGPTLSGWVAQNYTWNVMFYGMFLLGIINILFALSWFHPKKELSNPAFDLQGIVYSTVGFGGLLYGFSEAGTNGWNSPIVLLTLISGIVFLALFVWRQLSVENPLLNLRVLKYDVYTSTLIINSIITMALFGGMLLLPIYLQTIRGFTPMESGLLLLPGALIMGFMGPIAGKIFDKFGVRGLAIIGLSITAYASYEFTKLTGDTPYKSILFIYSLRSFGMSLLMMPIMTAGMNQLPSHLISHGTALTNTIRQVAGSIGTALLVTIMTHQTSNHLANYSDGLSKNNTFLTSELNEIGTNGLISLYSQAAKTSMIQGINDAFLIATFFTLVALVLSFFLRKPNKNSTNEM